MNTSPNDPLLRYLREQHRLRTWLLPDLDRQRRMVADAYAAIEPVLPTIERTARLMQPHLQAINAALADPSLHAHLKTQKIPEAQLTEAVETIRSQALDLARTIMPASSMLANLSEVARWAVETHGIVGDEGDEITSPSGGTELSSLSEEQRVSAARLFWVMYFLLACLLVGMNIGMGVVHDQDVDAFVTRLIVDLALLGSAVPGLLQDDESSSR